MSSIAKVFASNAALFAKQAAFKPRFYCGKFQIRNLIKNLLEL